jgi:hypothetical protein
MDWLRVHSARPGQRMCGMQPAVDEVTVKRSKEGKVSFGGLLTCGSRTCPNCGPRIAAATRTEIEAAIASWMGPDAPAARDRSLLFGTFTIRHHKGQRFDELASAVSAAWGAATGGRGWMKDREAHGIAHYLRVFEQKWSRSNGWHIHVHVLFFVDSTTAETPDAGVLLQSMFGRWMRKAIALGLGVPLLRAQDMHEVVDVAEAIDRIARYLAKETTDADKAAREAVDAGEQDPRFISAEMSNAAGKQGLTSLTPGQILAWAMDGERYIAQLWGAASERQRGRGIQGQEYARLLYSEFERGMKGRRTIAWSYGMREALGLGAEPTDAELAERQEAIDTATADTLVSTTGEGWRRFVARPGRRSELFERAKDSTPDELVAWLAGFGVTAVRGRQDRQPLVPAVAFIPDGELPF